MYLEIATKAGRILMPFEKDVADHQVHGGDDNAANHHRETESEETQKLIKISIFIVSVII